MDSLKLRRSIVLLLLSVAIAGMSCGGSDTPTNPTPTPTPTPTPSTFTLSGGVTESAPTTSNKIAGATVAFVDGTNAGKTATADSAGNYLITNVLAGAINVRASAAGYQDATRPVTINANTSLTIALNPTP